MTVILDRGRLNAGASPSKIIHNLLLRFKILFLQNSALNRVVVDLISRRVIAKLHDRLAFYFLRISSNNNLIA